MITVDAIIDKSQISEFGAIKGKTNLGRAVVGGATFEAGELRFCGFSGTRGDDKRYHGVFTFEMAAEGDDKRIPFAFLTNPASTQTTKTRPPQPKDK